LSEDVIEKLKKSNLSKNDKGELIEDESDIAEGKTPKTLFVNGNEINPEAKFGLTFFDILDESKIIVSVKPLSKFAVSFEISDPIGSLRRAASNVEMSHMLGLKLKNPNDPSLLDEGKAFSSFIGRESTIKNLLKFYQKKVMSVERSLAPTKDVAVHAATVGAPGTGVF
jgi:hypothetical protein